MRSDGCRPSAGAAALLLSGDGDTPARCLAIGGVLAELAAFEVMHRRLGDLAEPYERDDAGRYATAAKGLTAAGAVLTGLARRSRVLKAAGAALVLGGVLCERWAVYRAGFIPARDPKYTVAPQRARADRP